MTVLSQRATRPSTTVGAQTWRSSILSTGSADLRISSALMGSLCHRSGGFPPRSCHQILPVEALK